MAEVESGIGRNFPYEIHRVTESCHRANSGIYRGMGSSMYRVKLLFHATGDGKQGLVVTASGVKHTVLYWSSALDTGWLGSSSA